MAVPWHYLPCPAARSLPRYCLPTSCLGSLSFYGASGFPFFGFSFGGLLFSGFFPSFRRVSQSCSPCLLRGVSPGFQGRAITKFFFSVLGVLEIGGLFGLCSSQG